MKKIIASLCALIAAALAAGTLMLTPGCSGESGSAPKFKHPGIYQSADDMEYMKKQIKAGEEPWKTAFEQIKAATDLNFVPRPEPHIISGPYGKPNVGGRELQESAAMCYNAALVWYVTEDKAYADKALEIIRAWAPNVWDFDENNAKLLAGLTGYIWCNAAEILRYTDSGWQDSDTKSFTQMMMTAYYPVLRYYFPEANGNWDGAIAQSIMAIGIFTDNRPMFDNAVDHFLYSYDNGSLLKYVYPSGQCQETERDQGHVQMGLGEFAGAAHVAYTQGVDLFAVADNRLAVGFEYTAKVMMGEYPFSYGTISERAKNLRPNSYEFAYRYYTSKGYEMPYTKRAADAIRDRSALSVLTAFRAPDGSAAPPNRGVPQPGKIGYPTGAMPETVLSAPAGSVVVKPGESLQKAIDACAGTGKWVIAAEGLHTVTEPLVIPSGTTLAGEGRKTTIHCAPDVIRSIINLDKEMHDVTLRDFVLEGAVNPSYGDDPNSGRMARKLRLAPRRAGIIFLADKDGQMQNITFQNISVKNFTRHGIFVSGAANVQVIACDLTDSGSSIIPGPKLQHNLTMTHVIGATVRDSRMVNSPHGCGISMDFCRDVKVSNCLLARNDWFGMKMIHCDNIAVSGCQIEGNSSGGIMAEDLAGGSTNVKVENSIVWFNAGYGIESYAATNFQSVGNNMPGNRDGEQIISAQTYTLMP